VRLVPGNKPAAEGVGVGQVEAGYPGPDHLQERVLGKVMVTGLIESLGKRPGQADTLIELAPGKQSGIAGELAWRRLGHWRCGEKARHGGHAGA
jgi:hypothetical protein